MWYDAQIKALGLQSRIIHTPFGDTHILEAGHDSLPTLLLLPGTNFAAWSWQHYITALSPNYRVVAVDVIGQPGKSASERPSFSGHVYAQWLVALIDALGIESAYVMGHSLGGWLALKLAAYAPQRVNKLVLLDPGGIISLSITPRIIWNTVPFVLMPGEASARRMLSLMSVHSLEPLTVEWMTLVSQNVNSSLAPPAISASELQGIKADVLMMSGEHDIFLPSKKLAQKAGELFPTARIIIVPNSGHLLPDDQQDIVLNQVKDFLAG